MAARLNADRLNADRPNADRSHAPPDRAEAPPAEEMDAILQGLLQRSALLAVPGLAELERRATEYVRLGHPLHLRGPAGSGKTMLALRVAARLRRPLVLLVGDASFDTRRLVGGEEVTRTRRVVDRYISSVMKVESQTHGVWLDRAVAMACIEGRTLVYDEFNRAPPAANNVLLTVLEERLLVLPKTARGESYMPVHPEFRVIFTSNPVDHVGTNPAQDALVDRMITLDLEDFDRETELAIVAQRSGLKPAEAACIVDIVRDFRASREYAQRPTVRASIMIGCLAAAQRVRVAADDRHFVQICLDLLSSKLKPGEDGLPDAGHRQLLIKLIDHFCAPRPTPVPRLSVRNHRGVAA